MLRLQKMIQILLVAMLTQASLLLLAQPVSNRLVLSRPSFLFILGLILCLLCYAFYFSHELEDFKEEVRSSERFQHLRCLYFLMIAANAVGVVLLCGWETSLLAPVQQMFSDGFFSSSLLLLGMDLFISSPLTAKKITLKVRMSYRENWGLVLGIALFSLFRNPGELSCFLLYLGLGTCFVQLLKGWVQPLELSLLAHVIRNIIVLGLLPFCL